MISFPFDNKSAEIQDRAIDSDTFSEYLKRMIGTNGVFSDLSSKMLVTAGEEMTVIVKPGDGFIEGKIFIEDKDRTLSIQASESADRIDTVVVRLNKAERSTDLYVVKGTAGTSPKQPELTREGDIYELGIANIYIPKLTTTISQERITDTRLNSERCGVAPTLGKIDTTELYLQYQTSLAKFLETVAQAIDGTLAGNLQNQITENKNSIEENSNKIAQNTEDILNLKDMNPTLLFQGTISNGSLTLNESTSNYRVLAIGISAENGGGAFAWSLIPILPHSSLLPGYQAIMGYNGGVDDSGKNYISTYCGRIKIDESGTQVTFVQQITNVSHTSGKTHTGGSKYSITYVYGIR